MVEPSVTPTDKLFEDDPYRTEAEARVVSVCDDGLMLDRTLFYAESGGQPGDRGVIVLPDGETVEVTDTRYRPGRLRIVHHLASFPPGLSEGIEVRLRIDWERRYRHMRMHSCLHALCGLVNAPVTGCSIHEDRGRLDFDLPENPFTRDELDAWLQAVIARGYPLSAQWRSGEEVARALETVRTVKAPPTTDEEVRVVAIEGLDFQPCGGTHVRNTAELQGHRVARIQKKSKHNRRVSVVNEALGGG